MLQLNIVRQRRPHHQRGQGMTEYIIIVALIAVSAIGVYAAFGKTIRHQTAGLAMEMAGNKESVNAIVDAGKAAGRAAQKADAQKGLNDYDKGNH